MTERKKHLYLATRLSTLETKSFDDEDSFTLWLLGKDPHDFMIVKYERYVVLVQAREIGKMKQELREA
jgi:hypothetical protein